MKHELITEPAEVMKMVIKRTISILTMFCFAASLHGCYSHRHIQSGQLSQYPKYTIREVVTIYGEVIRFKTKNGKAAIAVDDKIEGLTTDGITRTVPLSQVKSLHVSRFDGKRTLSWVIGTSVAIAVFASMVNSPIPSGSRGGSGGDGTDICPGG